MVRRRAGEPESWEPGELGEGQLEQLEQALQPGRGLAESHEQVEEGQGQPP